MAAAKTVSTCTVQTEQVTHLFEIFNYSKLRGMGNGQDNFVRSGTFAAGGHDWTIRFYPDGLGKDKTDQGYVSVYLELMGKSGKVRASCDLRLVDQSTRLSSSVSTTEPREFDSTDVTRFAPQTGYFKKRTEFEGTPYVRDDTLTIECVLTVFQKPHVTGSKPLTTKIKVPPSDLAEHLGKMLEDDDRFDVTFRVGRETIAAHRFVLATRSRVFKAQLYGQMMEAQTQELITVQDMQPAVFKALIHFAYTDSLPHMDDHVGDDKNEMIRHLLVAADRYAMERLKLLCQSILCESLSVDTVASTLALADQYSCDRLKDACLDYITCSNAMDAVVKTQAYKNLKRTCPSLLADILEKKRTF